MIELAFAGMGTLTTPRAACAGLGFVRPNPIDLQNQPSVILLPASPGAAKSPTPWNLFEHGFSGVRAPDTTTPLLREDITAWLSVQGRLTAKENP